MRSIPAEQLEGAPRSSGRSPRIVVLIPCYNEEMTVGDVIADFKSELEECSVVVFDNNSSDRTAAVAAEAGAEVIPESRQGKGYVVASMLEKVDADIFVMVDGDSTYPATLVHALLQPILEGRADHVVGARHAIDPEKAYRRFHGLGNALVTFLVNRVFGTRLEDVMSGYRAFNRQVAYSVPVLSSGFDVETEFTLQTLEKGFVVEEVPVSYYARPEGSESKLSTFRDGTKVLLRIFRILKDFKPFAFFAALALLFVALSLVAGYPAIDDYLRYQYVYHVPLAILAGFLGTIGLGCFMSGVLLSTLNSRFRELHVLRRRDLRGRIVGS